MEDHPWQRHFRTRLRSVSGAEQSERRRHERSGDDPARASGLRPDRRDHHAFERTAVCPRRKEAWQKISVRFAVRHAAELRIHRSVRLYPRAENGNSARQPLWRHSRRAWHRPCVPVRGHDGRLRYRSQTAAPPLPLGQSRQGHAGNRPVHHHADRHRVPRSVQDALQCASAGGIVVRDGSAALRAGSFDRRADHLRALPDRLRADWNPARPRRDRTGGQRQLYRQSPARADVRRAAEGAAGAEIHRA